MKQDFLCVDDYGQGAVWFLVAADSPEAIRRKLPFLEIVPQRPSWMTDADYADIGKRSYLDVDNLPTEGAIGLALRMSLAAHRGDPPPVSNEEASRLINQDLKKLRSRED
jgi:hypothetical protein